MNFRFLAFYLFASLETIFFGDVNRLDVTAEFPNFFTCVHSGIGLSSSAYGLLRCFGSFGERAGRELLSPQGRSDSLRDRPNCADRSTRWPGVWKAGPRHPRR